MRTHLVRAARVALIVALPLAAACTSEEEKARRAEEAMVAMAKEDIAAESLFVHDSTAIAASITLDTVTLVGISPPVLNGDGDTVEGKRFFAHSRRGGVCLLDSVRLLTIAQGDTLRCQWDTTTVRR